MPPLPPRSGYQLDNPYDLLAGPRGSRAPGVATCAPGVAALFLLLGLTGTAHAEPDDEPGGTVGFGGIASGIGSSPSSDASGGDASAMPEPDDPVVLTTGTAELTGAAASVADVEPDRAVLALADPPQPVLPLVEDSTPAPPSAPAGAALDAGTTAAPTLELEPEPEPVSVEPVSISVEEPVPTVPVPAGGSAAGTVSALVPVEEPVPAEESAATAVPVPAEETVGEPVAAAVLVSGAGSAAAPAPSPTPEREVAPVPLVGPAPTPTEELLAERASVPASDPSSDPSTGPLPGPGQVVGVGADTGSAAHPATAPGSEPDVRFGFTTGLDLDLDPASGSGTAFPTASGARFDGARFDGVPVQGLDLGFDPVPGDGWDPGLGGGPDAGWDAVLDVGVDAGPDRVPRTASGTGGGVDTPGPTGTASPDRRGAATTNATATTATASTAADPLEPVWSTASGAAAGLVDRLRAGGERGTGTAPSGRARGADGVPPTGTSPAPTPDARAGDGPPLDLATLGRLLAPPTGAPYEGGPEGPVRSAAGPLGSVVDGSWPTTTGRGGATVLPRHRLGIVSSSPADAPGEDGWSGSAPTTPSGSSLSSPLSPALVASLLTGGVGATAPPPGFGRPAARGNRPGSTSTPSSVPGNGGPGPVLAPEALPLVFALSPLSIGINAYENGTVIGSKRAASLRAAGAPDAVVNAALRPLNNLWDAAWTLPRASVVDYTLQTGGQPLAVTGNRDVDSLLQSGVNGLIGAGTNSFAQYVQAQLPAIQQRNDEFYQRARTGRVNATVPARRPVTLALPARPLPYAAAPVSINAATMIDREVRRNLGLCQPSASDTNNLNTLCDMGFRSLAKGVGLQLPFAADNLTDQWQAMATTGRRLSPGRALRETAPLILTMAGQNMIAEMLTVDPVVDDPLFGGLRSTAQFLSDVGTGATNVLTGPADETDGAGVNLVRGYSNLALALGAPVVEAVTNAVDPVWTAENIVRDVRGERRQSLVSDEGWREADRRLEETRRAVHTGLRQTPTTGLGATGVALANAADGLGDAIIGTGTALTSFASPEGRAAAADRFRESGASFGRARDAAGVAARESWDVVTDVASGGRNLLQYGDVRGPATAPGGRRWCDSAGDRACVERGSVDPGNRNSVGRWRAGALVPGHPGYAAAVAEGRVGDQSRPGAAGYGRGPAGVGIVGPAIVGPLYVGDGSGTSGDRLETFARNMTTPGGQRHEIGNAVNGVIDYVTRDPLGALVTGVQLMSPRAR